MNGLHLTADLYRCRCPAACLSDSAALLAQLQEQVAASGLQAVAQLAHRFADTPQGPGGVTATVLLAESHVCLHTWPELAAVTLDVYVCNFTQDHGDKARQLMQSLIDWLAPERVQQHSLQRGLPPVP